MDIMRAELRQTIEGGLRRVDIESLAAAVLAEQGRSDLSPGKFSDRYFSEWTSTLKLKSQSANLLLDARKLIERTVSEIPEPPPLTGKQIMDSLGVPQGPLVGDLLRERDRLVKEGIRDPKTLLAKLNDYQKRLQASGPHTAAP
jgi:hypothetical protein